MVKKGESKKPGTSQCRRVVKQPSSTRSKVAVHRAFQSVVGITTYDVPGEMANAWMYANPEKFSFCGHGIIVESGVVNDIESEVAGGDPTYLITILAPAMLFKRTNGIKPQEVEFDVRAPDGKLYKGEEVLYCDFHYNLAAIRIKSKSSFKPASLMALNDVSSIDIDEHEDPQSQGRHPFRIGRHSNLFKVQPGTKIMVMNSSYSAYGVFSASHLFYHACKELYWVHRTGGIKSGAVINLSGDVLGMLLGGSAFLPSNFILKWWDNCTSKGKFCRPWVGVEVANLAEARLIILERLTSKFSEKDIGTGVIVTKVEQDTPAFRAGIKLKDVIVNCNGKQVKSKLEFFENMWDNAGNSVELTVLRARGCQELKISMSIEEATSTNFYRWMSPAIVMYE